MKDKNRVIQAKLVVSIICIILLLPFLLGCSHDVEQVREKIKKHLYEKYGEEFVVDRIGTRSSQGEEFYQARIYPKSIIGTKKQGSSYYYASATVGKLSFGRLGEVGDSYSYVSRNIDMEKYLLPPAKEKFGNRVLLKVDVEHEVTGDGSWWAGYKSKSLKEMRRKVKNDPKHNRILLDLDVYIFDKIENKKEKEKRRKDVFEFVQYLKEEGLFKYLEMRVVFVDERALAYSYNEFEEDVRMADKVEKEIKEEDITVKLPPKELRKEMSDTLQREVEMMNEEELLKSMQEIRKSELSYDGIGKNNTIYFSEIFSPEMLKERYSTSLKQNPEVKRSYNEINDVKFRRNLEYIYIN